jgi:hypothetical protein
MVCKILIVKRREISFPIPREGLKMNEQFNLRAKWAGKMTMNDKQVRIWKETVLANLSAETKTLHANLVPTENWTGKEACNDIAHQSIGKINMKLYAVGSY